MLAAALVLAAIGPFGTWAASIGRRLVAWSIFALGGYACFRPVILAGDALAAQSALPRWLAIAVACVLAAMPTTLIVAGTFSGYDWRGISAGDLASLYPQVLIVGVTVTLIQLLVRPRLQGDAGGPPPEPVADTTDVPATTAEVPPPKAALLEQLPPHLGQEILCIENEDHYIRVHTTVGNALILMRLRDAVAQLSVIEGEQVHRSWWVARAAVGEVIRTERRIALRLIDGREVPVSRNAAALLRDRGWL